MIGRCLAIAALLFWAVPTFAETLPWSWGGDLRVRMQQEKNADNEARIGPKLRVRFGVAAKISDELRAEIRLATARTNRSTNQSLGDNSDPGAARRFIGLDLGFVEWRPIDFFKLYGGRIPQLHYRPGGSQVILDEDIALEGTAFVVDKSFADAWRGFLNAGSVTIRENFDTYYSIDQTDNVINWGQAGVEWKPGALKVVGGFGFFNFVGVQGKNFSDLVTGGVAGGNTESTPGVIKNPYLPRQYFLESSIALGQWNLGAFAEHVVNPETSDPKAAWWIGVNLGRGAWDGQLVYCQLRSDAVLSLFTFSDLANGTTDTHGWVGSVRWKFAKNMNAKLTQFVNKIRATTDNKDYNRTHVDLSLSF